MSSISGYAQKFCDEHESKTVSQLRKMRDEMLQVLEALADREEFHSFQYAEVNWELDMINSIIKKKRLTSDA